MRERLKSDGIEGTYTTDPFGSDCIRPPDPLGSAVYGCSLRDVLVEKCCGCLAAELFS